MIKQNIRGKTWRAGHSEPMTKIDGPRGLLSIPSLKQPSCSSADATPRAAELRGKRRSFRIDSLLQSFCLFSSLFLWNSKRAQTFNFRSQTASSLTLRQQTSLRKVCKFASLHDFAFACTSLHTLHELADVYTMLHVLAYVPPAQPSSSRVISKHFDTF